MRIALVGLTHPYRGGISHFTTALYRSLSRRGEVSLISFSRLYPGFLFPGKTQFDFSATSFGAEVSATIDALNPLTWISALKTIRNFRPERVVLVWWSPATAFCYSFLARSCRRLSLGKPVFYCHNVYPHEDLLGGKILTRFALRSAARFLTHSESDKRTLRELFPGVPVAKAFHPVYDIFPKTGIGQAEARKQLSLNGHTLLFFGYVRKYKGLDCLVRALSRVNRKLDCTLVVAGEFYEPREMYERLIEEEGVRDKVVVHDRYIPNESAETYFAVADAVVAPYREASQSGIVQMAYHFGKPVIATGAGGLPEAIEDGHTGYVTAIDDPDNLADAILKFYANRETVPFEDNIQRLK
ncbi:MAG: glycosyltransferase, partial [Nitrospinae bacterium]|nr:glycosyltransferase [Nitrospinota bacterium]